MRASTYKELVVWQRAHALSNEVLKSCRTVRKDFISQILLNQLVRSVTSIPANIVEGFYSKQINVFRHHLRVARASAGESDYWLYNLFVNGYISQDMYNKFSKEIDEIIRMLSSFANRLA